MTIEILGNGALMLTAHDNIEFVILKTLHDADHKPLVFEKQTSGIYSDSYIATPINVENVNIKQVNIRDITEVLAYIMNGQKLQACKTLKDIAGLGLREAKETIDAWSYEINKLNNK